jgi:hypothetical protein
LRTLPETVGFEFCRRPCVRVLIDVIELLRGGRGAQLRHGGGVLRLVLLADVSGYRDGGEYPDNNDDRIVAKLQTRVNSDFVLYSPRAVSTA